MDSTRVAAKAQGSNPYTRICYLCGRQFGTASISIHEASCKSKWETSQAHLPKSKRLALPAKPSDDRPLTGSDTYNEAAFASYLDHSRQECPHCGRKFATDRLEIHLRSCSPGGFFARQAANRQARAETPVSKQVQSTYTKTHEANIKSLNSMNIAKKSSDSIKSQLPPLPKKPSTPVKNDPVASKVAPKDVANYCVECGSSFSSAAEKFCSNCGTKRSGF